MRRLIFLLVTAVVMIAAGTAGAQPTVKTYRGCGTKIVRSVTFRRDQIATYRSTGRYFRLISLSANTKVVFYLIASPAKRGTGTVPRGTYWFKITAAGTRACWTLSFRPA